MLLLLAACTIWARPPMLRLLAACIFMLPLYRVPASNSSVMDDNHRVTDAEVIRFLMGLAGYIAQLHLSSKKETNAGPRFHDDSIPAEEEGFARWMGWRGPEEQEAEIRKQRERDGT